MCQVLGHTHELTRPQVRKHDWQRNVSRKARGKERHTNILVGKCHFAQYEFLSALGFCIKSALDLDELHSWNK